MKNQEIKFKSKSSNYTIIVGNNSLKVLPKRIRSLCPKTKKIALIIDRNIPVKFKKDLKKKLKNYNLLFLPFVANEKNKSLHTINFFLKILLNKNFNRSDLVIGVGGGITGKGAHILLIDDPVKNREDAESENNREATWDWYTSTAYTRLSPGGGILVILTRWHDDDLAGKLLMASENGADDWEVVKYPAIAEEDEEFRKQGEPLHPERYNTESLEMIQKAIGPRDWTALYQQNPVSDEGDYFTRDMVRYYEPDEIDYDDVIPLEIQKILSYLKYSRL
mgnify:CR=1 FL=1